MATQLDKIFLEVTPSEQRKFIVAALKHLVEKYPKIVIPCAGQFTLAKCAIEAGYKKENITTSEISLFSSLLGYIYTGQPLSSLPLEILEENRAEYESYAEDIDKASFLLWLMKCQQLRTDVMYERVVHDALVEDKATHLANFRKQLENGISTYRGINFSIRDLRDDLNQDWGSDTILIVNPPAFKGGYEKMFNFSKVLNWNPAIEEFDLGKEYKALYEASKLKSHITFWYREKDLSEEVLSSEVVYGKQYKVDKFEYWLCVKPEVLEGFIYKGAVTFKTEHDLKKFKNVPMWGADEELTLETTVEFRSVSSEVALYYRDLWAHKLGNTKAEHYYILLLGGKVFATIGFHTADLLKFKHTRIFENYGFNAPSKRHPRIKRLMMMLITCEEMGEVLRRDISNVNRIYKLEGLRTTCLSKYRKVKSNNGILKVEKREKMKDGVYKIMYDTDFHKKNFAKCVADYLEEEKNTAENNDDEL